MLNVEHAEFAAIDRPYHIRVNKNQKKTNADNLESNK